MIQVNGKEAQEIELRSRTWSHRALAVQVNDAATYESAVEQGRIGAAAKKAVQEYFRPLKEQAHRLHKQLCSKESELLKPIDQALDHLRQTATTWKREQARLEAELARKAQEEARRLEEEERLNLAIAAEELGLSPDEILDVPLPMPDVAAPKLVPKVEGVATRVNYRAEVTDKMELLRAVLEGRAPAELVEPNMTALNALARTLKTAFQVPGCRVKEEDSMSFR